MRSRTGLLAIAFFALGIVAVTLSREAGGQDAVETVLNDADEIAVEEPAHVPSPADETNLLAVEAAEEAAFAAQNNFDTFFIQLASESELIVTGTVGSTTTVNELLDGDINMAVSRTTIAIGETLAGTAPGPTIDVRWHGGTVGDRTTIVSHMPVFGPEGEECLVFLRLWRDEWVVVNGEEGLLHLDAAAGFTWRGQSHTIIDTQDAILSNEAGSL